MSTIESDLDQRRLDSLRHALGPTILLALDDPDVIEIMLNDDGKLFIESLGEMRHVCNVDVADAMAILNNVSSAIRGELSQQDPFVEGELPLNGERFEGMIHPVVERPSFAIRKKAGRIYTLSDYVRTGVMTFGQAELLRKAIKMRRTMLIVGNTGSGKTTFVNALLKEMELLLPMIRMLILEDTKELQCALANRLFLKTSKWTDMARLAKAVKRLRPDSISVGEVREGGPALVLLKEWNTGHPGGFATVHANSAYEGLTRMDQLVQEVSAHSQRELISQAIHVVVFLERMQSTRRIKEILSVKGIDHSTGAFLAEPLQ